MVKKKTQNGRHKGRPFSKVELSEDQSFWLRTVTSPNSPKPLNRLLVTVE